MAPIRLARLTQCTTVIHTLDHSLRTCFVRAVAVVHLGLICASATTTERRNCDVAHVNLNDPTCLNIVGDNPPPIIPSHHARVFGIEPFERQTNRPWELHTIPTDTWYDRAKIATDACESELTRDTPGAANGLDDKIVWVSALLDLDLESMIKDGFGRPEAEWFQRFNRILDRKIEMIVYIPESYEDRLRLDRTRHHVIHMNASVLPTYFPYWDRAQAIRTSKQWKQQASNSGWLEKSPQYRVPDYNPFEMSKLKLLRDAARINPWGSRYHMWLDSDHLCAYELNPTPAGTSLFREHMSKGMFVTHWPYGTRMEIHGFLDKAMHLYMAQEEDPMRIVRSGIFGGELPLIECVLKAFTIALHQTLSDGYVGRDENAWTMIHRRLPHLFSSFDNNSLGNHGDNCASFVKAMMVEKDIMEGKAVAFTSPAIPLTPPDLLRRLKSRSSSARRGNANK